MNREDAKVSLNVINCDGCGACCVEQDSPPGYIAFLSPNAQEFRDSPYWAEDAERFDALPAEAREEIERYAARLDEGLGGDGRPCIWLDLATRKCRWYEHRPQICRDFDAGGDACKHWRKMYPPRSETSAISHPTSDIASGGAQ